MRSSPLHMTHLPHVVNGPPQADSTHIVSCSSQVREPSPASSPVLLALGRFLCPARLASRENRAALARWKGMSSQSSGHGCAPCTHIYELRRSGTLIISLLNFLIFKIRNNTICSVKLGRILGILYVKDLTIEIVLNAF